MIKQLVVYLFSLSFNYDLGKHLGIQTEFKRNDTNEKKVVTNLYVNNI